MRLFGYRRFVEATINLDAKMVAVLGPNESGKSSLLDALELFNDQNRVPSAAIHRDVSVDDSTVIGELVFRLSAGEREEFPYEVPELRASGCASASRLAEPSPSPLSRRFLDLSKPGRRPRKQWHRRPIAPGSAS
jgi:ABC-type Mn2+/Zn2+ transport system ATPase subunit